MKDMLRKEIVLTMHPTALIFLSLSMMMIIPNYPYYVTFYYTSLAIFFTCLNGREFNDIQYSASLPIAKKDIVTSRFAFAILLQAIQLLLAIPFAIIRQNMPLEGNQVGMEPNIAFFGLAIAMLGIFNYIYFTMYYKNVKKVGVPLVISSVVMFVYIAIVEGAVHVVPFVRDYLDTNDPAFLSYKLIVLGTGVLTYIVLTLISYEKSVRSFDKLDL